MQRQIIKIDESLCDGCGMCIPGCPEGALQIIDGKARLVSELFCDGLGACIGECPQGAISIEEREAEAYDERRVMQNIIHAGPNTIKAHLLHLQNHNQTDYYNEAIAVLREEQVEIPTQPTPAAHSGCPGAKSFSFQDAPSGAAAPQSSQLTHWPIQLHLISPNSPHFQHSDLLLAADCVAFSMGNFHNDELNGKTLAIACPKLDDGQQIYMEKIRALIDEAGVKSITVLIMQVPCCSGLLYMVQTALQHSIRDVPVRIKVVSIRGELLRNERL